MEKQRISPSGEKTAWKPGTMIYPLPAASSAAEPPPDEYNVLTPVGWERYAATRPCAMYRYGPNVTPTPLSSATWHSSSTHHRRAGSRYRLVRRALGQRLRQVCRVRSHTRTLRQGSSALHQEAPLSIECNVREVLHLGSHDMFIADVEGVLADNAYIDAETGAFDMEKAGLLVYSHGHYYKTGEPIGKFGWSVEKKRK